MNYEWADNIIKLRRAITLVGESSEQALMEQYIQFGGLIKGTKPQFIAHRPNVDTINVIDEPIEVKPKKPRGRPKGSKTNAK